MPLNAYGRPGRLVLDDLPVWYRFDLHRRRVLFILVLPGLPGMQYLRQPGDMHRQAGRHVRWCLLGHLHDWCVRCRWQMRTRERIN
jgi:hypothetical protein